MPRTKGSKNRPKQTNDYASQIAEKKEQVAALSTEIETIQKAIEEKRAELKEKKTALKAAEKEVAKLEAKKAKADHPCWMPIPGLKKMYAADAIRPKKAISMIEDGEGLKYPQIDESKCVRCYQCITVCPIKAARAQ